MKRKYVLLENFHPNFCSRHPLWRPWTFVAGVWKLPDRIWHVCFHGRIRMRRCHLVVPNDTHLWSQEPSAHPDFRGQDVDWGVSYHHQLIGRSLELFTTSLGDRGASLPLMKEPLQLINARAWNVMASSALPAMIGEIVLSILLNACLVVTRTQNVIRTNIDIFGDGLKDICVSFFDNCEPLRQNVFQPSTRPGWNNFHDLRSIFKSAVLFVFFSPISDCKETWNPS